VSDLPLHLRREEACCPFKDWSGGAGGGSATALK
jgi:hypothetical protein